ncbi:MAG: hypothetical protein FJW84_02385 [Actinobacteria bacterium]|nr:hypothetical protein [Actinomycetota bacterium]
MIKLRKNKIRQSSRVQLKTTQKIYMSLGILISFVASSFLYMSAENAGQRQEVWVTSKKIAAGQVIDNSNIELIRVDLGRLQANYLSSNLEIIGKTALEPLSSGTILRPELIGKMSTLRNVALRISNGHLPPSLQMNDWVDIWFSDPIALTSTLIIPRTAVVWIDEVDSNFGGVTTVVVAVPETNVPQLVKSARSDGIDLVHREN